MRESKKTVQQCLEKAEMELALYKAKSGDLGGEDEVEHDTAAHWDTLSF